MKLMPAKVEVFYHDPLIVMYYDAITESENRLMKRLAKPYVSLKNLNLNK